MDVNKKLTEIGVFQQQLDLSGFIIKRIYLSRKLFEEIQKEKCSYSTSCLNNFLFGIPITVKDDIDNYQLVIQPRERLVGALYRTEEEYKVKQFIDESLQQMLNSTTESLYKELNIDKFLNGTGSTR